MRSFLVRRLALALLIVVGVVTLTFLIARVIPGDPAQVYAGPRATEAQIEQARQELGLDEPVLEQLVRYVAGIFTGDWGTSLSTRQPVLDDVGVALPASLQLVGAGMLIAVTLGIPLGIASAHWAGRVPDVLIRIGAVLAASLPVFWLALMLQLVFFSRLGWFPAAGTYDAQLYYSSPLTSYVKMPVIDALITGNWPVLQSALWYLVLPALTVAAYPTALIARIVRASLLDTLGEEHVRMTRALGFGERAVLGRFALRPALNPVLQVTALVFAYSLANTFLVEAVYNWPGLGSYAAKALVALDTPALLGVTLVVAIAYVLLNLVVDLVQAMIDPRIRLS